MHLRTQDTVNKNNYGMEELFYLNLSNNYIEVLKRFLNFFQNTFFKTIFENDYASK